MQTNVHFLCMLNLARIQQFGLESSLLLSLVLVLVVVLNLKSLDSISSEPNTHTHTHSHGPQADFRSVISQRQMDNPSVCIQRETPDDEWKWAASGYAQ